MKVNECMSSNVCFCTPDTTIRDVAKMMQNNHVGCVPVCDNNKEVVGILTDRDIILRGVACDKDTNTTKVSDIMTTHVCCCTPETSMDKVTRLMSEEQIKRIPVINNNKLVGMLTLGDIANNQNITSQGLGNTIENICNCDSKKNAE